MTSRKKQIIIAVSCVLFVIVYLIFAVSPVDHSLKISPVWTVSIDRVTSDSDSGTPIPFKLGQRLGYFTENGNILLTESFPYMATVSSSKWATYTQSARNTSFYTTDGEEAGTIAMTGFPYFTESNGFLFMPGGMSFSMLNEDGSKAWSYEYTSPITSFTDSPAGCTAGYADGHLILFNPDGKIVFSTYPGGSDYEVIIGSAVSGTGDFTACISGLERQRFVLYRTAANQTKIVFHEYLEGNLREQTFVKFSNSKNRVFANEKNGLLIVDTEQLSSTHIPITGKILDIKELEHANLFAVLVRNGTSFTIYIFEDKASLLGSFSFDASYACINTDSDSLYVGRDTEITKLEISK
ncbi:MAG: hypothetical protein KBT02_04315 [Treponema sp.]|nr:hypothetical protein [Candidatus Treponema caballi]